MEEHPVTERFFQVFTYLKDRGLINSQRDFSQGVGFPETHFHAYKKGQRRFGIQHLTNLYRSYHVSLTYMVSGKGPIMEDEAKKDINQELAEELAAEKAKVQVLEREREEFLKQITFYQELLKERLK